MAPKKDVVNTTESMKTPVSEPEAGVAPNPAPEENAPAPEENAPADPANPNVPEETNEERIKREKIERLEQRERDIATAQQFRAEVFGLSKLVWGVAEQRIVVSHADHPDMRMELTFGVDPSDSTKQTLTIAGIGGKDKLVLAFNRGGGSSGVQIPEALTEDEQKLLDEATTPTL